MNLEPLLRTTPDGPATTEGSTFGPEWLIRPTAIGGYTTCRGVWDFKAWFTENVPEDANIPEVVLRLRLKAKSLFERAHPGVQPKDWRETYGLRIPKVDEPYTWGLVLLFRVAVDL